MFFDVAYQSYLPSLVRRDQLVEGNSKLKISALAAQLGGPATAGGLVSLLSAPWAVLDGRISFLGAVLVVLRIPQGGGSRGACRACGEARHARRGPGGPAVRMGGRGRLRALTESSVIFNFCANGAFAVYLVYAVRSLGPPRRRSA